MRPRWFAHVDMDAFYASVEVLDFPELEGLPMAVGGPAEGRGVIAAASYEAREFGVRSAMPTAEALRKCPHLVLRKGRMSRYQEKSREIMSILREVSPKIAPISLDEAFLDLTGCERLHGPWNEFTMDLRMRIHAETGLWASIGMGETRRIAKIASDLRKPRGMVVVDRGSGPAFLAPLSVRRLWGVGPKMYARLEEMGLTKVGDIAAHSRNQLQGRLGKMGLALYDMAHAQESGSIDPDRAAKSISHEVTFAKNLVGAAALEPVLMSLCEKVGYRLRREGFVGRVVHLKIRDGDFNTISRQVALERPTDSEHVFYDAAKRLLHRLDWERVPVRLIGVGLGELSADTGRQGDLFATPIEQNRPRLEKVLDDLHSRFGGASIGRARTMLRPEDNSASWEASAWERPSQKDSKHKEDGNDG